MNIYAKALLKTTIIFVLVVLFFYICFNNPLLTAILLCILAVTAVFGYIFAIVLANES